MAVKISNDVQEREADVSHYIEEYAELASIDPNLVRALITQESRFIGNAVSPTNAYGFGQFTNIGARQVVEVAKIHNSDLFGDMADFQKREASDPDRGIKAVCAFLWWLFYVKYKRVENKQVKLEASLTFYNAGGRPAALVVKHGGFTKAVPHIKALPARHRSQGDKYAGEVSLWYVAWHELMRSREKAAEEAAQVPELPTDVGRNPFDVQVDGRLNLDHKYKALVEALKLVGEGDPQVDVLLDSRDGLTEVTLILPGDYTLVCN